jgi:hypothetical protein
MIDITFDQITAAQAGDASAVEAILIAMKDRTDQMAYEVEPRNASVREDIAAAAWNSVWEYLGKFTGTTVAEYFTYASRTARGVASRARREITRQGIAEDSAKRFEKAVRIAVDGDPYEAEQIVQDTEHMGAHALSAAEAYAARLSYMGIVYLDMPVSAESARTLGDVVSDTKMDDSTDHEELAEDRAKARRTATGRRVRRTLDAMGEQQRIVLSAMTGIGGTGDYGTERDDDLSADTGIPRNRIKVIRSKGKDRFASLYVGSENF